MYSVYIHKNTINGKIYIGITSRTPKERWDSGHGYKKNNHFWSAIQKYGWNNFSHEILHTELTKEQAEQIEIELIKTYKSTSKKYGYNSAEGGRANNGFKHTERTKKTISAASKEMWSNESRRIEMSERMTRENHPSYGAQRSDEAKEKMRKAKITSWQDPNYSEKMSLAHKSRPVLQMSQYTKEVIKEWRSAKEAIRQLGFSSTGPISNCCNGRGKTAFGYAWGYAACGGEIATK